MNNNLKLTFAVSEGDADLTKRLIESKATIEPEHMIIAAGCYTSDCLKILIEARGDPYVCDSQGRNTLFHAAKVRGESTKLLLELKMDPNTKDNFGSTPLFMAASGDYDSLNLLIEAKAEVNIVNNNGDSPLFLASIELMDQNVKRLIEAKANTDCLIGQPIAFDIEDNHYDFGY